MKLDEIFYERKPAPRANKLLSFIEKNCSEYLKEKQTAEQLYRRMDYGAEIGFIGMPPRGRSPVDTDSHFQKLIDAKLKKLDLQHYGQIVYFARVE